MKFKINMKFKIGDKIRLRNIKNSRYLKEPYNKTKVFDKHLYGIIVNDKGITMTVDWHLKNGDILEDWGVFAENVGIYSCEIELYKEPVLYNINSIIKNLNKLAKNYV